MLRPWTVLAVERAYIGCGRKHQRVSMKIFSNGDKRVSTHCPEYKDRHLPLESRSLLRKKLGLMKKSVRGDSEAARGREFTCVSQIAADVCSVPSDFASHMNS